MQIEVVTESNELARLETPWRSLLAQSDCDNPFLQWEWASAWWREYGTGHELAVLVARDGAAVIGIAPVFIECPAWPLGPRTIRFLGTGEVFSEYLSFIAAAADAERVTREFLAFLCGPWRDRWHLLRLSDMPASSAVLASAEEFCRANALGHHRVKSATCWSIRLASNWDAFLKGLSRNRREKVRRHLRDLSKHGFEASEVATRSELASAWESLKELHQKRWTQCGERGCFASPRFARFHEAVLGPFFERGMLSLCVLRAGDQAVAVSYCLRHRGVVSFYQAGIDPAWMHTRPGHILRAWELRRAIERGDRTYDFLGGDTEYKLQWATDHEETFEILASAPRAWARCQRRLATARRDLEDSVRTRVSAGAWNVLRRLKRTIATPFGWYPARPVPGTVAAHAAPRAGGALEPSEPSVLRAGS